MASENDQTPDQTTDQTLEQTLAQTPGDTPESTPEPALGQSPPDAPVDPAPPVKKAARKRASRKATAPTAAPPHPADEVAPVADHQAPTDAAEAAAPPDSGEVLAAEVPAKRTRATKKATGAGTPAAKTTAAKRTRKKAVSAPVEADAAADLDATAAESGAPAPATDTTDPTGATDLSEATEQAEQTEATEATEQTEQTESTGPGRRRSGAKATTRGRRRRATDEQDPSASSDESGPSGTAPAVVDEEALRFDALDAPVGPAAEEETGVEGSGAAAPAFGPLFQAPEPAPAAPRTSRGNAAEPGTDEDEDEDEDASAGAEDASDSHTDTHTDTQTDSDAQSGTDTPRRRRRRGGKGRRSRSGAATAAAGDREDGAEVDDGEEAGDQREDKGGSRKRSGQRGGGKSAEDAAGEEPSESSTSRRRTRRRRRSGSAEGDTDEPGVTTKVRESRRDEVTALKGSTRLEAKKQRRREGREAGRRRTVITEAEFLARRESVDRVMVVRRVGDRTQIGVLEDGVLVEHYISKETNVSMAGNIYLGRVQNVLPSMEAAFVDIGKGRNAVLYAGEVNWDAAGLESGQPKRIEHALTSGESVLVQVTKDPIGHKGARLTSQISLPGRYLVYVPNSAMTGISRKLPDTERSRLKKILKEVVPDTAGVIVRTAAEGASEEELRADVERLTSTWTDISARAEAGSGSGKKKGKGGNAPLLLHGEPDLTVRVIRDIFNEDFASLVVAGEEAWTEVSEYVGSVAPDLADRVSRWTGEDDLFTHYRVDEQIAKAMDRKVWLPSGGSLVIDRTEAMTVVDVNTGKFIGSGGNLEETVTKNNLEAAEEIVRQLRLRDVGGIIVIDFIDMVLESNRDLVVRRLLECLGRDRTKHQVAEVTSLGLVQMTRKRVGSGLIEVFSETCEVCGGRGIIVHSDPVDRSGNGADHGDNGHHSSGPSRTSGSRGKSRSSSAGETMAPARPNGPTPAQIAAAAHAAALKTAMYAGEPPVGDAAGSDVPAGQDQPLEVVLELDLADGDTVTQTATVTERATDAGTYAASSRPAGDDTGDDTGDSAGDELTGPAEPLPPVAAPSEPLVMATIPEHPTDELGTGDAGEAALGSQAPAYPAVAADAPVTARPRRHRGRVVAPAGPPRSTTHDESGPGPG